jgi:glutamine---fructose-6-phosphate transaminase (isomerizing)
MQHKVPANMCSIAAYVGSREAPTTVVRCGGVAADLEDQIYGAHVAGTVGVAHMRCERPCALDRSPGAFRAAAWAMPAATADQHPHLRKAGPIALVYDGILENRRALHERLTAAGCTFSSETDAELVGHLIHASLAASAGDLAEAVWMALQQVEGTYAIAVASDLHGERVVVARRDAPLVVGLGWGEAFVASEESAIHELMSDVIVPNEGEVVDLTLAGAMRNQSPRWPTAVALAPERLRGAREANGLGDGTA